MVFNILVGNTDDHGRNHAAFWDGRHLTLTPAYDICPQGRTGQEASQAMSIHGDNKLSQLGNCLAARNAFQLSEVDALGIMRSQVRAILEHYPAVCREAGLSEVDQEFFWRRQFLNPYCFYDLPEPVDREITEGLQQLYPCRPARPWAHRKSPGDAPMLLSPASSSPRTWNLELAEWGDAFPSTGMLGTATLDRLRHGAYRVVPNGESYRAKRLPGGRENTTCQAAKKGVKSTSFETGN